MYRYEQQPNNNWSIRMFLESFSHSRNSDKLFRIRTHNRQNILSNRMATPMSGSIISQHWFQDHLCDFSRMQDVQRLTATCKASRHLRRIFDRKFTRFVAAKLDELHKQFKASERRKTVSEPSSPARTVGYLSDLTEDDNLADEFPNFWC